MKYIDQAKWFLNGFWKEGLEGESENVWKCTNKFIELDAKKKKEVMTNNDDDYDDDDKNNYISKLILGMRIR